MELALVNRIEHLEAIQEARYNIIQNNANQSWVSSVEMRRRMQARGVAVASLVRHETANDLADNGSPVADIFR